MNVDNTSLDMLDAYQLPAIFSLNNLKNLTLSDQHATDISRRHLAYHVKRYPLDLRAHVQRILISKEQETLSGSLQDLFIALKNNGLKIRQMIYKEVHENLSEEDQVFFSEWLEKGYDEIHSERFAKGSILSAGLNSKSFPLITVKAKEASSYASHYQEAVDCIEYGQLNVAQELLEQEMLSSERDPRTEEELLRVYSYTQDEESKARVLALLTEQNCELNFDWKLSDNNTNKG